MKKVFLTGNKGFIGSQVQHFLQPRYEVIGCDLKDGKDILNVTVDDLKGVDYVIHIAAHISVQESIEKPLFSHEQNIKGTLHMLEMSAQAKVKKFVFSSSASVYGSSQDIPLDENSKIDPLSPYAITKATGEMYCKFYSDLDKLDTVILRYFNVFGEGMKVDNQYSSAIAIFLERKRTGVPLHVFGGYQTRDYIHVKDVAWANLLAIENDDIGCGEVFNIGSGEEYRIKDIAHKISDKIDILPYRSGEPMRSCANNKKAKEALDWQPTINLFDWLSHV